MMTKRNCCIFLLSLLFLLSSVFADPVSQHQESHYKYISVKELYERLKEGQGLTLLDVRSSYAYQMEHIKEAVSFPLGEIKNDVVLHPLSRTGVIVTYCSCPRHEAEMAADVLAGMGYHNAFVLYEGLPGWKKDRYPVVGQLANQPMSIYWVVGYALDKQGRPKANVVVRVFQPRTQQLEIGKTDKTGFYALELRFYGLVQGDALQVFVGNDVVFFNVGPKEDPWGTRIDDVGSHISHLPNLFLKTFKTKKLHLD